MSGRMETNGTIFPTWSVALPTGCLAAAFFISLAATALGDWSNFAATALLTFGLGVVAIVGLRHDGLFGGSGVGSWLLLIFAMWPLGSVLLSTEIASANPQNGSPLFAVYPILACVFYLIAFVASLLAARSMPLLPIVRYANAALFGAILLTLAFSWAMVLVNATASSVLRSVIDVVLSILTSVMPVVFAASLIWFGYIHSGVTRTPVRATHVLSQ